MLACCLRKEIKEKMEEGDNPLSQSPAPFDFTPLILAILEDDWKAAEVFIQKFPNCIRTAITKEEGTALHFAAAAKRTRFVEQLVKLMTPEELELKTNGNYTSLYYAAQSKIVTIAKEMVKKNNNLPLIPKDDIQVLPLYAAIKTGNRDMVSYLYSVTPIQDLASADLIQLLNATISTDLYDTSYKILNTLKLTTEEKELHLWSPLKLLARKPSGIGNKSQPSVWERCLNSCFRGRFCNKAMMQASAHQLVDRLLKELRENKNFSTLVPQYKLLVVEAAKVGNVEFLIILIRSYPHLIWEFDEEYGTLFHVAIKHRQERVFNLIYEIGVLKDNLASLYAEGNKSMLHLVEELPSSDRLNIVSGAALQMQRELLWFQVRTYVRVLNIMSTSFFLVAHALHGLPFQYFLIYKIKSNWLLQEIEKIVPKLSVNGPIGPEEKPPRDIFVKNHEELQKNGEQWMRNTANSCMLVAALIATVVFPAAFTVPGGNNQETGIPMFLETSWFTVFFISNAVAMLFSSSSILVFLSILTSRYTEKDFLRSLPLRLAWGLTTLVISIVGMLIAFIAACFLVFKSKNSVPIRIIIVAVPTVPISLFGILHYRLWFDIVHSAFCSKRFLFGTKNRLFIPSQQRLRAMETKNDNQTGHNDRNQVRFTSPTTSHPIPLGGIRPNYEQGSSV